MTMHPGHPGNYPGEDQDRVLCSLLVPCRDEAASVEACLDSLAASPLPARATWDEWIIVDDASSDTTAERVKGWASTHPELPVRLRVNVERSGKAAILEAVRARLTAQPGDRLMLVCDADGLVAKDAVGRLVSPFVDEPGLAVAWGWSTPRGPRRRRLASRFQSVVSEELARAAGPEAAPAFGGLFAMRPKKLDGFHWREGLISDDIILAEHVRASGAPHRLVIGATIAILPAAGYRDFYLQTYRSIASRAAIRAAGLEAPRIASRGRLRRREVAAAVGRAVCREPLGLPAYVLARTVAAVTQYLDPEHFGDRWTISRSTKGSTWEAGHSSRATARSSGTSIRFLRPVFVPWAKLAAAIRLTRRCEHGARTAAVIALGLIPGTARFLPRDLVVTARSGPTLRAPRAIESYSPLVEVMGNDCYHFGRLPWERRRDANLRVLDVGAHVGAFAVTLAARYPEAMFTCFEPAPESYSYLEQNAAANGLAARISCHRAAVGTTAGTARLLRSGAASSEATLVPALAPAGAEAIAVPVVDLATAISIGGPPDLVKLDCEGGEYEIVLKSDPCLWESVHCLLLEYHPVPGQSWAELETHLHGLGFRTAWHEPGRFPDLGTAMLQR